MAVEVWANDASAVVTSGGTTAPSAGTVQTWTLSASTLPSVSSSASPPTQCYVADPAALSEVILITNVSGSTATVTRGADGTSPVVHAAGFTVVQVIAGATLRALQQVVPPSGDTSGVSDTAAINAVTQAGLVAVMVPGALYYTGNITAGSYGGINGNNATWSVVAGTTGYALTLKTAASTKNLLVSDLVIQCNNVCGGVQVDNTGFAPIVQYVPYDSMHHLRNVFVNAANGDAFHLDNQVRSMRMTDCVQYHASGYGLYLGNGGASSGIGVTDCHFTNFLSGKSGLDGIHVEAASGNNVFTGPKSFYAGWSETSGAWTSSTAVGFYNAGNWQRIIGYSGQQSALHGITLSGCADVTLTAAELDTNSAGTGVTTGCGINLTGSLTRITVTGCIGSNNSFDPPGAQAYGIQLDGTLTDCTITGNSVTGANSGINETGSFVNNGGNIIIDPSQAVFGSSAILQANPGAYVQGQTTAPSPSQFFGLLWNSDPAGTGYGRLASVTGAGLTGLLQQSQASATSGVTVASSSTITSIGSLSVPANDPVAGARYRVTAHGTLGTLSSSPGTVTVDLRWGGTGGTLITSVTTATMATSLSAAPVEIEGEVEFYTTTTCVGWLKFCWRASNTTTTALTELLGSITSPVTVTTSSSESLSLDWTWSVNNASNTVTIASSSFERVA